MSVYQGRFAGRTAIITGGASGLGKAVARRMVAEGGKAAGIDLTGPAQMLAQVAPLNEIAQHRLFDVNGPEIRSHPE